MGEPADTPAVPKRRRRWLIAVVVLGIVSLGTWWYWPRGDQRFVGKWAVHTFGKWQAPIDCELIVKRNGSATWVRPNNNFVWTIWSVRDGALSFGIESNGWLGTAIKKANSWATSNLGSQLNLDSEQWVIENLSGDEIRLRHKTGTKLWSELRRVPE